MKRLVILTEFFPPAYMATGQLLEELARSLSDKHEIEVVTSIAADRLADVSLPYRVKRLTFQRRDKRSKIGRALNGIIFFVRTFLYLLFRGGKAHLLIVSNPPFMAFCGSMLHMLRRQRFTYLVHDQYPEIAVNLGYLSPGSIIVKIWKRLNRSIYRRAWKIITLGDCMKKEIASLYPDTPFIDKAVSIHNWSRSEKIYPMDKEPLKQERGLEGKFIIQYSGNHGLFHGLETVLDAAELLREHRGIHIMFVGDGGKKSYLVERVEKEGLENVSFHDYVPLEKLGQSLACADVALVTLDGRADNLAVPSKFYGCLAAGLPVIGMLNEGTDIAELITRYSLGYVTQPGNAPSLAEYILQYYNNKPLITNHAENCRSLCITSFDLPVIAGQYESLIFPE
jgi:glycosyltransferase involved in cell wall biosynthesis